MRVAGSGASARAAVAGVRSGRPRRLRSPGLLRKHYATPAQLLVAEWG